MFFWNLHHRWSKGKQHWPRKEDTHHRKPSPWKTVRRVSMGLLNGQLVWHEPAFLSTRMKCIRMTLMRGLFKAFGKYKGILREAVGWKLFEDKSKVQIYPGRDSSGNRGQGLVSSRKYPTTDRLLMKRHSGRHVQSDTTSSATQALTKSVYL